MSAAAYATMAVAAVVTRLDFRIDARASDRSESVVHEAGLFQGRIFIVTYAAARGKIPVMFLIHTKPLPTPGLRQ